MFRSFLLLAAWCALAGLAGAAEPATAQTTRPNIVLIYADDLGYGDLGCYGATDHRVVGPAKVVQRFLNTSKT